MELAQALRDWHDFYVLGGTAAATLVGLTFVAASIGASYFEEKNSAGLRLFLSPTVVHFSAVLIASLLVMVPGTGISLGALLLAAWVAIDMRRRRLYQSVDFFDRLWYALTPMAGYLVVMMAAVGLLVRRQGCLELLATGLGVLLLVGMRNAWDMAVWIAIRAPNK
jgi:hypothetical protein